MAKARRLLLGFFLGALGAIACTEETPAPQVIDAAVDSATPTDDGGIAPDAGQPVAACADGIDNDGDGRVDLDDPGCDDASDDDETEPPDAGPDGPACSDGIDNDGDGQIDYPDDPGCESPQDPDENDPAAQPACDDGVDNDMDSFTDFPDDPGCGSVFDTDEYNDPLMNNLPQCADGIDNDNDGQVDVADPGCASPADPRETDPDTPPACANGVDDDGDGIVDFPQDPGCSAAGDEDETTAGVLPACADGRDNDGDGLLDYPDDPGCAGVGDRDETDPPVAPACADGVDNDRDGAVDYPEDRGCTSAGDGSELGSCGATYQPIPLQAGRPYLGNTRQGAFETEGSCGGVGGGEQVFLYRVEEALDALVFSTEDPATTSETAIYLRRSCLDPVSEVACGREPINDQVAANRLEVLEVQPGDYYVFVDAVGPGGPYVLTASEVPRPQCRNGRDDDGDGRVDYPSEAGCASPDDDDERDPVPLPACADDEDNDGDGLVDFPLDLGCQAAADEDEVDVCGQGVRVQDYPVGEAWVQGDTSMGGTDALAGTCGGAGSEIIYRYANPFNASLTFSIHHEDTTPGMILHVRESCAQANTERGCEPYNEMQPLSGNVSIDRAGPGDYFVIVDSQFGQGGPYRLLVDVERLPPGCQDGVDNDMDGFIDGDDLGCDGLEDEDERDPPEGAPQPACWDQVDNDDDGFVDFPFDPGCAAKGGLSEDNPQVLPACSNGMDDDEDDLVDFPADRGCQARGDDSEENGFPGPECSNNQDDDNDGQADYPFDPGCDAAGDTSERNGDPLPACADNEDNDRDGLVDFPFDPGCGAASGRSEQDPAPLPLCANGVDDDGDGIADFPFEPGCRFAGDQDEADPAFPPQCANERDDDNDGRVDYPDDQGCDHAADNNEANQGPVLPRCSDGRDNDVDGLIDLADVGCVNADDDDEADPDPGMAPWCADGIDNDQDGAIDWPDDDGCAAQGDDCEQAGFALCDGICLDVIADPANCGRCGRACNPGVECLDGRCGQLRPVVLVCGRTNRNVQNDFIRGDLAEAQVVVRDGCDPDDDTQAVLIPRGGIGNLSGNAGRQVAFRDWVGNGGQLICEYNICHTVYNLMFQANSPQGGRNGSCQDEIQPVVQFTPNDAFWQRNAFEGIAPGQTGCGYNVGHLPGVTPLGGWDANNVSIAYRDLGAGRVWLVDIDWQDGQAIGDPSKDLMASMIGGF